MQNKKTKAETLIKELDPRLKEGKRYNLYYGLCKQNGRRSIDGTICYNETKTEILQTLAEELITLKIDEFGAEALTICRITPHGSGYERLIAYITAHDLEQRASK